MDIDAEFAANPDTGVDAVRRRAARISVFVNTNATTWRGADREEVDMRLLIRRFSWWVWGDVEDNEQTMQVSYSINS